MSAPQGLHAAGATQQKQLLQPHTHTQATGRRPACTVSHHQLPLQVNGGSTADKVDFGYNLFEQSVSVDTVIAQNDMIDTIAITKGRGTEGVVTRWGVTRLPRKTHRGLRKVSSRDLRLLQGDSGQQYVFSGL